MDGEETVFERHYENYLAQLKKISFKAIAPRLGGRAEADTIKIPLFEMNYDISASGIADSAGNKPSYDICVILSKYLLSCPETPPQEAEWVSFKNFKDSGPLINYFDNTVKRNITSFFKGKPSLLRKAGQLLPGYPPDLDVHYDVAMQFDALPRVPIVLLFNDADENFPPSCTVLFERRAEKYLDAECLAMLGWQLFIRLRKAAKR